MGALVIVIVGSIVAIMALDPRPAPSPSGTVPSFQPSATGATVPPPPAGLTYADFAVDPTIVRAPTASAAQSKLWYADGSWWGALFGPVTQRLGIFRLDGETQVWADTGTLIDERPFADADLLWTGSHLYAVTGGSRPSDNHAVKIRRFSYDEAAARYVLDSDFPVTIRGTGASPAVLAADTTGTIWATYVADDRVWLTHTLENDTSWSTPTAIWPGEASVDPTDVASLVAFGPGQVGLIWTNGRSGVYFSAHEDGAPDDAWSPPEPVMTTYRNDESISIAAVPAAAGRTTVAAVLSTTLDEGSGVRGLDPLTLLAIRDDAATWTTTLVGLVRDRHARPLLLVDPEARTIAIAATSPGNGGAIYYKRSPLDRLTFDTGLGVPLIANPGELTIDRVTAAKGPLAKDAGLVVLASDRTSGRYLHGVVDLGGGAPTADPADPDRPAAPAALPAATTTAFLRDTFEPWPLGKGRATGWYVRPEDPQDALAVVDDGGDGQALRVPSSATGVRACRDVPEVEKAVLVVRARVRLSRIGLADATILSVRGSGGESASLRVTNKAQLAWFDRAIKTRSTVLIRPGAWYRITARIDQTKRTYDFRVTTDSGTRLMSVSGRRWRMAAVRSVRSVCLETAAAPPAQAIDLAEVSVFQNVAP